MKYRIIKKGPLYFAQMRFLYFFWIGLHVSGRTTEEQCKNIINRDKEDCSPIEVVYEE